MPPLDPDDNCPSKSFYHVTHEPSLAGKQVHFEVRTAHNAGNNVRLAEVIISTTSNGEPLKMRAYKHNIQWLEE